MDNVEYAKGLEGVIATESRICSVNGADGVLLYRGYVIEDLAAHASFEEVTYLLLYERLPTAAELAAFSRRMRRCRALPPAVLTMVREFPRRAHSMELLQSVISYLSGHIAHHIEHSSTCNCRDTLHQIAQLPTVIAARHRLLQGLACVPPRDDLSHGANFLYMLRGAAPDPMEGEIMDRCLVLHAEHGLNASTFAARVVASTLSTCYCSIAAAIGSLFGSLHGGANERVLAMLDAIGTVDHVESWIDAALAEKRKIMGMGHRVYRVKDPRAKILERDLERLVAFTGDEARYALLKEVERITCRRLQAKGKKIYPNVDFFSGALYAQLGIPPRLYTPIFAMARSAGWLAHILEQRQNNRLFRPRCLYVGPEQQAFAAPADRG